MSNLKSFAKEIAEGLADLDIKVTQKKLLELRPLVLESEVVKEAAKELQEQEEQDKLHDLDDDSGHTMTLRHELDCRHAEELLRQLGITEDHDDYEEAQDVIIDSIFFLD